jgi:glucose-1-phosphate adenylyltransferase
MQRTKDVLTVILGGGRGSRLDPLTRMRSKPAVPIAGKYRLIDIALSNAINSGLNRVFVLTQFNSVSLHRHIGLTYHFDTFSRGFVQILAAQQTASAERWYQGTADAVRQNLRFIREMPGDLVLILSGDHMYRMDYRPMIEEHLESGAAVTIAVHPSTEAEIAELGAVRIDASGRVVEFHEKPRDPAVRRELALQPGNLRDRSLSTERPYLGSMGIYLFDKATLIELLSGAYEDFGRHLLPIAVETRHVQAFVFDHYWRDIGTIRTFFDAHMDLVEPQPSFDFFDGSWPFYTHPRYLPGSKLDGTRFERSVLSEGSVIYDSVIEGSIVGIRSRIYRATVRRSLIMGADPQTPVVPGAPPVGIGEGSVIENAIIDKNARVGREAQIINAKGLREADGPGWAIRDGIVVVPKSAVIPDGTVI